MYFFKAMFIMIIRLFENNLDTNTTVVYTYDVEDIEGNPERI